MAAGAIARRLLADCAGIEVLGWVSRIHDVVADVDTGAVTRSKVEADATRCPDPVAATAMAEAIGAARSDGDSLGGIVTCVARNVPVGLGAAGHENKFVGDEYKFV